ncbi:NmrA family transcriptional regulator [Klebsiella michiganensis]|uniref:NmrA family transcriptional regulator n=1 Tax=Klebsiella michiganensis TaxID=1134687 RepID=UPI0022462342|nr:NmrA family transcriptional regulator [Klebsiella michiganensis]
MDDGRLAGHADLAAMRQMNPPLQSIESWPAGTGRVAFERTLAISAGRAFKR